MCDIYGRLGEGGVDNWWCQIACVKGWTWSAEENDQCLLGWLRILCEV